MNKHISNFLLSLTIILGLTLGLSPTAYASESVTEVKNFDEFVSAVANGGYVKLGADFDYVTTDGTDYCVFFNKETTIDLNGHTLCTSIYFWIYASVRIIDSSPDESGVLQSTKGGNAFLLSDGSLTLESGTLSFTNSSTNGIDVYQGPFTMTGGTIESAGYSIWRERNNVSISGGTIKGGFYENKGEIDITGGKFSFDPSDLLKNGYAAQKDGDCLSLKNVDSQH